MNNVDTRLFQMMMALESMQKQLEDLVTVEQQQQVQYVQLWDNQQQLDRIEQVLQQRSPSPRPQTPESESSTDDESDASSDLDQGDIPRPRVPGAHHYTRFAIVRRDIATKTIKDHFLGEVTVQFGAHEMDHKRHVLKQTVDDDWVRAALIYDRLRGLTTLLCEPIIRHNPIPFTQMPKRTRTRLRAQLNRQALEKYGIRLARAPWLATYFLTAKCLNKRQSLQQQRSRSHQRDQQVDLM